MHIIFGDSLKELPDSFTVLELDTFVVPGDDRPKTAYCVVEKIPLNEFDTLAAYLKIHQDLMQFYKQRHWTYCEHAIEGLMGRWNGELDTFYSSMLQRVQQFKEHEPEPDWTGTIVKG